jgi:hypothetical protein
MPICGSKPKPSLLSHEQVQNGCSVSRSNFSSAAITAMLAPGWTP